MAVGRASAGAGRSAAVPARLPVRACKIDFLGRLQIRRGDHGAASSRSASRRQRRCAGPFQRDDRLRLEADSTQPASRARRGRSQVAVDGNCRAGKRRDPRQPEPIDTAARGRGNRKASHEKPSRTKAPARSARLGSPGGVHDQIARHGRIIRLSAGQTSVPLVEGTRPAWRGSISVAVRSTRATALKQVSAIWWLLAP